jgi:hypothetical protein
MHENLKQIVFLSYPSLGILDNWLPVLYELKKKCPNLRITALLPRPRVVSEIDTKDILIKIGQEIFDDVVFKTKAGDFAHARSFAHAKEMHDKMNGINLVLRKAIIFLLGKKYKQRYIAKLGASTRILCFDLFARSKRDGRDILRYFSTSNCFSVSHGLAINDKDQLPSGLLSNSEKPRKTRAYLYSKHEIEAYKQRYGLTDGELKVVGVPRHDEKWMNKIITQAKKDIPVSWNKYIFVVSRPAITEYLTQEEKIQAIRDIKKLCFEDLCCNIVVKLHPTERVAKNKDNLYEQIFGKQNYGERWVYSSAHPFLLGKGCLFAISFYSGVVIDMLALDRPAIERMNLSNVERSSKNNFDAEKQYRKRGLVLPAENYEELRNHAMNIMKSREEIVKKMKPNYVEFFGAEQSAIEVVGEDILCCLNMKLN